jgi:putative alpha-1,2-mannosidase
VADTAREVLADFVKDQLEQEDKRRASLETRGVGVITVSGTLVTLLFGISAVVTKNAAFTAPAEVRHRLSWALLAFAVSSVIAIGTTMPLATQIVDANRLGPELQRRWDGTLDAAQKQITGTRMADLSSAQRINTIKSLLLMTAVTAQVVAVLLLAWSVSGLLR